MKKVLVLILVLLAFGWQTAHAAEVKIGIVDLMKALNESENGKKAKAELETLIKSKQSSLDEKGREIEKLKGELDKQASVLSPEAKKSREEDLERLLREYQRLVSDSQTDVKKKESELTGEILKELRAIIDKIGQEGGYTMVIENADGIILYSKKEINLTETVIKRYNEAGSKNTKSKK